MPFGPRTAPRGTEGRQEEEISDSFDAEARMAQVLGQPPRIAPQADGEYSERVRELLEKLRARYGGSEPGEIHETFRTLLRHHEATEAYLELGVLLTLDPALPARDKELAILRTAWLCGAPIPWGEHVENGRMVGLDSADFERLTIGAAAPGWNEADRAIVRAAEELHFGAMISDETWAALAARLDERQLIELPIVVGHYHMTAFLQNSLRFAAREGNQGLAAR
jgi:alkylhydroperoxidase family enzyme